MDKINNIVKRIITAYNHELLRKNDTEDRNKSNYDMVTTYAPALTKIAIRNLKSQLEGAKDIKTLRTNYLHYRDEENNSNKYHFYAVFMIITEGGETVYAGTNVYGRVGRAENFQLLGKRIFNDARNAEAEVIKHMNSKLRKGYQEIKLRRGSKKSAQEERVYFDLGFDANDKKADEILRSIFGQLSDGMWENTAAMEKYWRFGRIEKENSRLAISVYKEPVKGELRNQGNGKHKYVYRDNGWFNKSAEQIKQKLASLLKTIVKQELKDNGQNASSWNRNNTTKLEYLSYHEDITVKDAYRVYDTLLDRKTRIFI